MVEVFTFLIQHPCSPLPSPGARGGLNAPGVLLAQKGVAGAKGPQELAVAQRALDTAENEKERIRNARKEVGLNSAKFAPDLPRPFLPEGSKCPDCNSINVGNSDNKQKILIGLLTIGILI